MMIANDPNGGMVLKELRIKEGQTVKRDEIIAVMGNYPAAEVNLKIAENNLLKTERMRETILRGTRVVDIQLQEDALKSAIESDRLSDMLRNRSGKPPKEKELEIWLAEQSLKNQPASLELSKRRLAIDLTRMPWISSGSRRASNRRCALSRSPSSARRSTAS